MAKKKVVEETIVENILPSTLDELMGDRFDIYAKDVIQDRAIPDVRDGMKPVQRRIIYGMWKTGNVHEKPTKKCAHIVGEVMGKYHPHGDSSIYNALVRMSQPWNMRLPLIDFQGNNGSMDGDGPAAYRYTEARLAAVSHELIRDLEKDTVDMALTFDDTEFEPVVLPARFPALLVNGTTGIAVGIATEIPPHNLKEVVDAVIYRIGHPNCPIESLMRFVPGPDFPTGGIIYQSQGLQDIYLTGKGRIDVVGKTEVVTNDEGVTQIIITEIPYGVVKSQLVFQIDKIRHDRAIDGIDEVRDETDKNGLRIAIDLKKGFKPEAILAYLMGKTDLKTGYSANMVCIVDGRPLTIDLLSYCDAYIAHQEDVLTRRCKFDLKKSLDRLEIVEGLLKAASIINEVIDVIRHSKDKADAKINIQNAFGFTPNQSEAIVMMPLYKLSNTDIVIVTKEKNDLDAFIADLREILGSIDKLHRLIISDLKEISKKYGDDRRTSIEEENTDLRQVNRRDLIAVEDVMVAVTRDGYIKRSTMASWKGSSGHNGAKPGMKAGDTLIYCGQCVTTDFMLMFTNKGNYLYVPVHLLRANKWLDEGQHVNYAISLPPDEKIVKAFAVRKFRDDLNVAIVSKDGQIKRTKLSSFPVIRINRPIRAMRILTDDEVVDAVITSGDSNLLVMSDSGLAAFYNENLITLSSTSSSGVKAGSFHGAEVAALLAFDPDESGKVLLYTDLGNVRVFSTNNIEAGPRLGKATVLFKSFKKEPHRLIYACKVGDKEAPYTIVATLEDGGYQNIVAEDFLLTPMDKYAKRENNFPKNERIAYMHKESNEVITKETKSFAPPAPETPEGEEGLEGEAQPSEAPEDPDKLQSEYVHDTSVPAADDQPVATKFEQISIFGDDDF
ncbi:MAG: DNA topoisomerase IV subunit A [Bacilli bacterium]|nr:DNA topoisomerase IV subunit A [Bacilli bacterium]